MDASQYGDEPDSGYGDEVGSYTTSLASNITNYKIENNRRYHAYKEGSYPYPNDEKESDRLDIMHKLTEVSLGGKLNLAPVPSNSERILDIGTGTGIWAMEMGDKYPNAEILGNDLSAIQPRWVPPNVRFEIDDVEADWTYHQKFDYIHCRFMGNAIQNWPRLIPRSIRGNNQYEVFVVHTKPGGWVECIDLDLEWNSPDGSLTPDLASKHFNTTFLKASRESGMEPCPGPLLEGWLKDAGFKGVAAERHVWPVGTWPADKHLKEVGAWNYLQIMEGLEAFTYALFTRVLGYSQQEVDVVCAKIRREMRNSKMHAYFYLYVAYGKKPDDK
ncbi:MAG: hypothetical protein ALECFALPRED_010113 [Alectoria fallacina]|uniref:S-adenosyl-L-methionine-dependent methyltransferase n=1 Tax=Alectoria fallacina TaxID=1903189 RepID=A0A8H3EZA6_9LECA|nr:MAG: hypothetical protein ALECFALPRED_010113 [Alectoria fallacina]